MIGETTRGLDEGVLRGVGRDLIPRVLAGLVRRGEDFDAAEDALQEALRVWPEHSPRDPAAWLATVATRRLVDHTASVVRGRSHMTSRTSIHSYSGAPPGPGSEET